MERSGSSNHLLRVSGTSLFPRRCRSAQEIRFEFTAGFREGKNAFKNNDIAKVRDVTDSELVLHDGLRMRRDGARIDQGVCITSHASQCRTVDQVVVLPDGADAKGWYVSLSRARDAMHVYTRDKAALRQSGDVPRRAQVSVGAYSSFAKVRATIQESNDARPLGDTPSRNSLRDWNGALARKITQNAQRRAHCGLLKRPPRTCLRALF